MKTTQDAVTEAVSQIGKVLTDLVAVVDANARESTRAAIAASISMTLDPAPHANGVKPIKAKKTKPALRPSKVTKPKKITSGAGGRRTPEEMSAQAAGLFSYINANPGVSAEAIAKELGVETKELPGPLKLLLKEKKIRASGKARGTTYTAA